MRNQLTRLSECTEVQTRDQQDAIRFEISSKSPTEQDFDNIMIRSARLPSYQCQVCRIKMTVEAIKRKHPINLYKQRGRQSCRTNFEGCVVAKKISWSSFERFFADIVGDYVDNEEDRLVVPAAETHALSFDHSHRFSLQSLLSTVLPLPH